MTKRDDIALDARPKIRVAPALKLEPARYMGELADMDITEDQKRELLETLWSIMESFVRLGFDADVCTAVFGKDFLLPAPDSQGVDSKHTRKPETR